MNYLLSTFFLTSSLIECYYIEKTTYLHYIYLNFLIKNIFSKY